MKERTMSAAHARRSLSEILSRVAFRGERIVVTLRGKPAARIVPMTEGQAGRLGDVPGWLEDDDPFFRELEAASRARSRRVPRVLGRRRT